MNADPGIEAVGAAAVRALEAADIASPRLDARLLLAACFGDDGAINDTALAQLEPMLARRIAGEPISRILGRREFWSLDFELSPATLDPRPDSETVIEAALARIADRRAALRIADLGTGTGCLLLALLSELPEASGVGVDIEPAAVRMAAANAARLGLGNRASFTAGNWGAGLERVFDCVLSNPPYIPSADIAGLPPEVRCDPRAALDGGRDGLDGIRGAAGSAAQMLVPGGLALIEIGAGQAREAVEIVRQAGLRFLTIDGDLAGHPRVIVAHAGERCNSAFTIR